MTSHWLRRTLRAILIIGTVVLSSLTLVAALTLLQAQRDETARADAILILSSTAPSENQLAHAIELYRRGYATRVILVGHTLDAASAYLAAHWVTDEALLRIQTDSPHTISISQIAAQAEQHGITQVIIVDSPERLLLDLKMARDYHLTAYGSPPPNDSLDGRALISATIDYWTYVLFSQ